jgi:amino acid transporter
VDVLGINFGDTKHVLSETFLLFVIILAIYALVNIFADQLLGMLNNISVGWHVLGVIAIIALLIFVPDKHQSASFVFGHKLNNTGFDGGSVTGFPFWFLVLPIGFILTMYTQTGYDASAHTAEETRGAAVAAAQGVWRSVFFSALAGWAVLLALLFAVNNVDEVTKGGGGSIPLIVGALSSWAAKAVILIATVGQIFCGAAGLTSASRTWYAFSRDRAIPGWWLFRRLNRQRVPIYAVLAVTLLSLIISIPALWGNKAGFQFAFFALIGICTVGLYIAYVIPVYLRWRQGDNFERGPWNLGRHYRWINILAVLFAVVVVITGDLPATNKGVPWNEGFDWTALNYTPAVLLLGILVGIWWKVDAHKRYQGPVRTIETDELGRVVPDKPEPPPPPEPPAEPSGPPRPPAS